MVNAVRALQNHVLAKGSVTTAGVTFGDKFSSINDYYADNSVDFPVSPGTPYFTEEFAALSQQAGHTIEDAYIL